MKKRKRPMAKQHRSNNTERKTIIQGSLMMVALDSIFIYFLLFWLAFLPPLWAFLSLDGKGCPDGE